MLSFASLLAQWFKPPAVRPPPRAPAPVHTLHPAADPRPWHDGALPAVGVTEVIAPHSEWLLRLRYAYGAEQVAFDRDIVSVVERYAQYVHLLPATADRHFRAAGGLFGMGLEIAFYALQATDGAIFSGRQTITQRSTLEPRWRYATFLAGLCSELDRALSRVTVLNDRGEQWPALLQPLWLWLRDTKSPCYHVRWRRNPEPTTALGVAAVSHIVTPAIMQYLAHGNAVIVPHLMASFGASVSIRGSNTLERLVRRASALVVENDRRTHVDGSAPPVHDGNPGGYRVPALRRLAGEDKYLPNGPAAGTPAADGRSIPHSSTLASERSSAARALVVPARLHPAVRDALRQIIASLDSPARPLAALRMERGVFVPLHEFELRNVDPALAVRALSDAGMLAGDPSQPQSKTCSRTFANEPVLGVVLAPHCISGQSECAIGVANERSSATT